MSLKMDVRFDGEVAGSESGFVGRYLKLLANGNLNDKFSYSFRHRLYVGHSDPKAFFNATDWANVTYKANDRFSVTAGKQMICIGTIEYDYAPIDVYFASDFWNHVSPFQVGVNVGFKVGENNQLYAQITNSPFSVEPMESLYAYNVIWYGKPAKWNSGVNKYACANTNDKIFLLSEEEAINYFSKAVKIDSQNSKYAFNLSNAYFTNGWMDEALKFMNVAICLEPENCEYRYAQAYSYFLNNQYEKSLNEIKNIFKINPDYVDAQVLEALIKSKMGDPVYAKVELDKIVKENPKHEFAIHSLAQICIELEQLKLACKWMGRLIDIAPTLVNKTEYANLLIDDTCYGEAQEIIENMLTENPKYLEAYILQAKNYIFMKDYDSAFESAQQIIEIDQNNANGYFYNALALFEIGDTNFAIESMKKAISLDVNNAMYYVRMSEFYQKLGQYENALAYISEAASIDESAQNKELYAKLASIVRKSHG